MIWELAEVGKDEVQKYLEEGWEPLGIRDVRIIAVSYPNSGGKEYHPQGSRTVYSFRRQNYNDSSKD